MKSPAKLEQDVEQELESARSTLKNVDQDLGRLLGRDSAGQRGSRRIFSSGGGDCAAAGWEKNHEEFGAPPNVHINRSSGYRRAFRRPPADSCARAGYADPRPVPLRRVVDEGAGSPPPVAPDTAGREAKSVTVVGSRLWRPGSVSSDNDDYLEEKPVVQSHVVAPREVTEDDSKSRRIVLQQRKNDKENINRSRRMFGALLGTLQRFKNDELKHKEKVDKRAQVERKLEDNVRRERVQLRRQRADMLAVRKRKQHEVKLIEMKAIKVREAKDWEKYQLNLMKFARTVTRPHVFFLPKIPHVGTEIHMDRTRRAISDDIEQHRRDLQAELRLLDERLKRLQKVTEMHSAAVTGDDDVIPAAAVTGDDDVTHTSSKQLESADASDTDQSSVDHLNDSDGNERTVRHSSSALIGEVSDGATSPASPHVSRSVSVVKEGQHEDNHDEDAVEKSFSAGVRITSAYGPDNGAGEDVIMKCQDYDVKSVVDRPRQEGAAGGRDEAETATSSRGTGSLELLKECSDEEAEKSSDNLSAVGRSGGVEKRTVSGDQTSRDRTASRESSSSSERERCKRRLASPDGEERSVRRLSHSSSKRQSHRSGQCKTSRSERSTSKSDGGRECGRVLSDKRARHRGDQGDEHGVRSSSASP